jgi:primosomal protein N' (replication factor Y)
MSYAAVVPDTRAMLPHDVYTYSVPEELDALVLPGVRVQVPFGKRSVVGIVVERSDTAAHEETREIAALLDEQPLLLPHQVRLALLIAERYCAPLAEVIRAMVPKGVRAIAKRPGRRGPHTTSRAVQEARADREAETPLTLTPAQADAARVLTDAIAQHRHRRVLLHGVTGSGKTEVYLAAIAAALAAGRGAIVLVPEIALTPQMIQRFAARFPRRVAVVHSALTDAERAAEWQRIRAGEVHVVVGSRSAVFAPVPDLGVVVVDEEDSAAYKQDRVPRYHAVEVALLLGDLCDAPVVLGSATPRVETFFRAHDGDLELVSLPARVTGRPLPPIEVVDLREELRAGNTSPLSQELTHALEECHAAGGQSILFLNRRGMAPVVLCRSCGNALASRSSTTGSDAVVTATTVDSHACCPTSAPRAARSPSAVSAWEQSGWRWRCRIASLRCGCCAWTATRPRAVMRTSTSTNASGVARPTASSARRWWPRDGIWAACAWSAS